VEDPVNMSWGKMNKRMKAAERQKQQLMSSIGPVRKEAVNQLEDLKMLREEMKHVEDLQEELNTIRKELAAWSTEGGCADEQATAPALAQLGAAEDAVKRSVMSKLFGSPASSTPSPSKGFARLRQAYSEANLRPTAAPLWVCSPESGWHANLGVVNPGSRGTTPVPSPTKMPTTKAALLPPSPGLSTASARSIITLGSVLSTQTTPTRPVTSLDPPLVQAETLSDTYGNLRCRTPLGIRYDGEETRWVSVSKPINRAETPSARRATPTLTKLGGRPIPQLVDELWTRYAPNTTKAPPVAYTNTSFARLGAVPALGAEE